MLLEDDDRDGESTIRYERGEPKHTVRTMREAISPRVRPPHRFRDEDTRSAHLISVRGVGPERMASCIAIRRATVGGWYTLKREDGA